ncbi:Sodium/solute symporter, partial [Pavlovales sp. CCMP2436]
MMSSLSSSFNSASTTFTVDVYHRFIRPDASERELLWCGRIATAATCVIALLWLPVLSQQRGEFYLIVQNATSHIAPALPTVVLLGILWPRVNSRTAFAGLLSGSVLGLAQYGVNLAF